MRTAGAASPEHAEAFTQELQRLMNEFKVIKLDVALDPFNQGPMKLKRQGHTINLN